MPNVYIIAGCKGVGKTTASYTLLPEILNCKEFVNADETARGLSPFHPEGVSFQAGRIMLERIRYLINEQIDFTFETTLATKCYLPLLKKAKASGYVVILFFLWLDSSALAKERVKGRILEGGHSIPDDIIERRYYRGIENLQGFIPIADDWIVVNNSSSRFQTIATGRGNIEIVIHNADLCNQIVKRP